MDGIKELSMIFNMENVSTMEAHEKMLSGGMRSIIEKIQKTKSGGSSVLEKETYHKGNNEEEKILKVVENGSPQLKIIKTSKLLCEMVVENPEKIAA